METILIDPHAPGEASLARAAGAILAGGLVVFPTETFYALGADPRSPSAIDRLFSFKRRPSEAPVLLLLSEPEQASLVAGALPASYWTLAKRFWPGPLTLVVPAGADLSPRLTAGTGTIGVRQAGLLWPRRLAARMGFPVTGTSANISGRPPAASADEVTDAFGTSADLVSLVVDGGKTAGGPPSSVVDLTGSSPRLVRAGAVDFETVLAVLAEGA